MEQLHQLGLALIAWLQASYPQIGGFMAFISALGSEEFFLVVMPAFYWSVDKRLGKNLGYLFLVSITINPLLKNAFRMPRPYWLDPAIGLTEAEGYGLPSGHVQYTTVLYLFLATWIRRWWMWLLAFLMIGLMALSRIYLGLHFPTQALGGFLVGMLILAGYFILRSLFLPRYNRRNLGSRLLMMMLMPLTLAAVYLGIVLLLGRPDFNVEWASYIPSAEADAREGVATGIGALLGFGVGLVYESNRVRFRTEGSFGKRLGRYLVGIVVTVAIWAGLDAVFPDSPQWLALPLRVLRYFLILLWVSYLAPWVFVKLRLATADPESEIKVTL
jgi:membrane-associated phospholipid phosphatase